MYVGDAAECIVQALEKYEDIDEPLNIGTGEDITIKELVDGVRNIKKALDNPVTKKNNFKLKKIFEKSLSINKNLKRGHKIVEEDLETTKPKDKGIDTQNYVEVIGKQIIRNMKKGEFLNYKDLWIPIAIPPL